MKVELALKVTENNGKSHYEDVEANDASYVRVFVDYDVMKKLLDPDTLSKFANYGDYAGSRHNGIERKYEQEYEYLGEKVKSEFRVTYRSIRERDLECSVCGRLCYADEGIEYHKWHENKPAYLEEDKFYCQTCVDKLTAENEPVEEISL